MSATPSPMIHFLFGDCPDKPKLPDGFDYIVTPHEFLLAGDGVSVYYVTRDKLIRRKIATEVDQDRTGYRLRIGKPYMDDTDTIPLC